MSTPIAIEKTSPCAGTDAIATPAEAIALGELARVTGGADKPPKPITDAQRKELEKKLGDGRRLVAHELTHVVQSR